MLGFRLTELGRSLCNHPSDFLLYYWTGLTLLYWCIVLDVLQTHIQSCSPVFIDLKQMKWIGRLLRLRAVLFLSEPAVALCLSSISRKGNLSHPLWGSQKGFCPIRLPGKYWLPLFYSRVGGRVRLTFSQEDGVCGQGRLGFYWQLYAERHLVCFHGSCINYCE